MKIPVSAKKKEGDFCSVRKNLLRSSYLISLLLIFWHAASSADNEETSERASQDIAYLDYLLELTISSGSFLDLNLEKTPASITVISKDMIKISGARNISELLEIYVPGFQYMFNKWNGTLWGLRGVANDRNTKIIYLVNGHKLNTQARDGFQGETVLGLLDDIERVEVLRGPAGLVYGSGAIAGIVNVITRKTEQDLTEISVARGENNSQSYQTSIYRTIDKSKLSFSLGYRKSDGFDTHQSRIYGRGQWPYPFWLDPQVMDKDGFPSDGNFGSTDGNWRISASWEIGNFNIYARATRQKENAGGLFIIDPWPELKDGSPTDSINSSRLIDGKVVEYNDPFWSQGCESYGDNLHQYLNDNFMVEAGYTLPVGNNEITARLGFDGNTTRVGSEKRERYQYESEYHQYAQDTQVVKYWDMLHPAQNPDFVEETFGEKRLTFNTTYHLKSIPRLQLASGLEYRLDIIGDDLSGKNVYEERKNHPVVSNVNYHTFSLFSEGFYDFTDKIGAHLGGRLDFHTRAFMANPKVALVFRPNQLHSIKLMYQTSSNNGSADNYEYNKNHYDNGRLIETGLSYVKPYNVPDEHSEYVLIPTLDELHNLKPEKTRSVELSSYHKFKENLSIMPSLAYGNVSDLFVWSQKFYRVINVGNYSYFNAEMDVKFESRYIKAGASHSFQRPVYTNVDDQQEFFVRHRVVSFDSTFDSEVGRVKYHPVTSDTLFDTIPINIVKDAITADGKHFLNMATNITKLYLTVMPVSWLSVHSNLRLFWGLQGRDILYDKDTGFNYWNINDSRKDLGLKQYLKKSVSKKLNASVHFYIPYDFELSFFAYDILGMDKSFEFGDNKYVINSLRWQHMSVPEQKELYSTDQRTFELKLTKYF